LNVNLNACGNLNLNVTHKVITFFYSEVIAVNQDKVGKMGRRVQVRHLIIKNCQLFQR